PRFLDILPLYILLLAAVPLVMALPWRALPLAALASLALYLGVQLGGWHLKAYPDERPWTFNPLGWQMLFFIGLVLGRATAEGRRLIPRSRPLIWLAALYAGGFCLPVGVSWAIAGTWEAFPALLSDELWPLRKPDLDPWRLANLLAIAYLVATLVPKQASWFLSPLARPVTLAGRHGLDLFCLGIFLSVFGHAILTEVGSSLWIHVAVSGVGCAVMIGYAAGKEWLDRQGREAAR
ncbi:MAG: OpgC domain-containing protein, partial [Alphaproteobacteria bacterium]|nr:OpgC domain-containing protein [Alphaproteobacteria bacterium]